MKKPQPEKPGQLGDISATVKARLRNSEMSRAGHEKTREGGRFSLDVGNDQRKEKKRKLLQKFYIFCCHSPGEDFPRD